MISIAQVWLCAINAIISIRDSSFLSCERVTHTVADLEINVDQGEL